MSLVKTDFTKEEIVESGVWYGMSTLITRLTAVINTFLIIYFLTLYEYGVFRLILSLVGIFQAFILSGLDGVIRNEIAHYLKGSQPQKAAKLFFEYVFLKGSLAGFVWGVMIVFINIYFSTIYDSNFTNILLLASTTLLLNFISDASSMFYRGVGAISLLSKMSVIAELVKLFMLILIFWLLSPSIQSVFIVIIFSQIVSLGLYFVTAYRDLCVWWHERRSVKEFIIFTIVKNHGKWSLGNNVLSGLVTNGRNYIIKFLLSTEAVAVWNLALSMFNLLYSVIPSDKFLKVFLPYKIALKDLKVEYYKSYVKYLTMVYIGLMVAGWIGSVIMVNILFPAYKPALPIFYIVSLGLLVSGVNDFVAAYLYTLRYQKILFYRTLQRNILTISLMFIFVHWLGFIGLGLEYLITNIFLTIFSYLSLIKLHPDLRLGLRDFYLTNGDWRHIGIRLWNLLR